MIHRSDALRAALFSCATAGILACSTPSEHLGSDESALKVCGKATIKGIDVYHGDNGGKPINWTAVKGAGITFAFAKATEGSSISDPMFSTNWAGMKSAGLVRGAYHFFHADVDPDVQATFFLSTVGLVAPGDLLVLDLETANGQSEATIAAHAATFLAKIESATGRKPILYVSPGFLMNFAGMGSYPLWVANYGVACPDIPAAWSTYTFWQNTGTGSLGPVTGALDLDSFNGTLEELQALGSGASLGDGGISNDSGVAPHDAGATPSGASTTTPPAADTAVDAGSVASPLPTGGCAVRPSDDRSTAAAAALMLLGLCTWRAGRRRNA